MKNYFDFIIYLAFQESLIQENKRSLTLEQLHLYRLKICEKHIKYHSRFTEYDSAEFESRLKAFHKLNINMTPEEENQNFVNFIHDNSELFTYENGIITLTANISFGELQDKKFELASYDDSTDQIICGELIGFSYCIDCLNILGLTKVKDFVTKIIQAEKEVEGFYQAYSKDELKQKIEKLLRIVNLKLSLIANLSKDRMNCFHRIILRCKEIDSSANDKKILLSDYLMENDEFYGIRDKYIDVILSWKYLRAIFGTGTLVYDRLNDVMDAFWLLKKQDTDTGLEIEPIDADATAEYLEEREEIINSYVDEFEDDDDNENIDDEYDDEEETDEEFYLYIKNLNLLFYLNFINHLNEYLQAIPDNSLEISRSRLLYILDAYGDDLYLEENFNKAINSVSIADFPKKDELFSFYVISRLFLIDILEGWTDEFLERKLLYIQTYYDLTEDKRIKRIINKYKKTEIGKIVAKIIYEHDYSQMTSVLPETIRLLKEKK